MSADIIVASEGLLKRLDRINKFSSKYSVYPFEEAGQILDGMRTLADSIPSNHDPQTKEDVVQTELKRRLEGESLLLEQRLSPRHYDFQTVTSIYGVPSEDIEGLRGWLEANRQPTLDAIERIHRMDDLESYELGLPSDIPGVRRQAEEVAAVHIQKYHKRVGKLLQDLTSAAEFLRDIDAVPTSQDRSYFNPLTKTFAIAIPAIIYTTEDGSLHLRERELIRIYGHEGMGHAINELMSQAEGLPHFLTQSSPLTMGTMESIAQFYQRVIFDDLKDSPETQKALGIAHNFGEIHQEAQDIGQLQEYQLRLTQYAISVLADKKFGDPQDPEVMRKKVELVGEVTLDPSFPLHFVEQHRHHFDSQGNLNPSTVGELRYCAKPVDRILEMFEGQGMKYEGSDRSTIDTTILTGFWTPEGHVNNARLVIEGR